MATRKITCTRKAARRIIDSADLGVPEPAFSEDSLEALFSTGAVYRSFDAGHGCRFRLFADRPDVLRQFAEA